MVERLRAALHLLLILAFAAISALPAQALPTPPCSPMVEEHEESHDAKPKVVTANQAPRPRAPCARRGRGRAPSARLPHRAPSPGVSFETRPRPLRC